MRLLLLLVALYGREGKRRNRASLASDLDA